MESPRKFNDCYFYYYSTCTKGDNCVFRHEPSALGCETMCTAWQQGKCTDKRCKLRHMELRKNRKQIPCYWENQPGGCRKKHCPFMHKNPDARTDGIAPSQPAPPTAAQPAPAQVQDAVPIPEQRPMPPNVAPQPAPMSVLWQQQRQILDSALLGVLPPNSAEILSRRVMAHEPAPNPYAPLAVDPLVVNFEEESDNESAPSSTPTKSGSVDDAQKIARTKSQELLLLERIQAEAAAFYNYDSLPVPAEPPKERKIVRANLPTKYDRLSLDEIAGNKQTTTERRKSLDFKVLSLEEIRARKKTTDTSVVPTAPITINLSSRKRKSSTTEAITTSGNKILKLVRSNSIVYKKLDKNAPAQTSHNKQDLNQVESRKRTLSEQSALIYDMQENELVDNCYEFKRIKINEQKSTKPLIIRNRKLNVDSENYNKDLELEVSNKIDNESDTEVQFVCIESADSSRLDVIDLDSKLSDEDVVDLSECADESGNVSDEDIQLVNVPDVVASCQKNGTKTDDTSDGKLSDLDEDALLKDDDDDL